MATTVGNSLKELLVGSAEREVREVVTEGAELQAQMQRIQAEFSQRGGNRPSQVAGARRIAGPCNAERHGKSRG